MLLINYIIMRKERYVTCGAMGPSNYWLSLILAIELQNQVSSTIQISIWRELYFCVQKFVIIVKKMVRLYYMCSYLDSISIFKPKTSTVRILYPS
jgi:hypothetical protein